jgi:phosphatidylglycerophosphate synthase
MTWATRITILRLILVPVFVTFIITYTDSDPREEAWRYAAIGVTLSLIPLGHLRPFPIWFPAIIISRDALLLGGYCVLRHFQVPMEIRPHWTGKVSTVFTLMGIGAVLFKLGAVAIFALCALGAGFALACTVIYVRQGLNLLSHSGHTHAQSAK